MSITQETMEKRRAFPEFRDDIVNKIRRVNVTGSQSPKNQVEHEKRIRREIANSNERRRMQSINTGFETLRTLLPAPQEGEKLSKATILQMAAKYIKDLHAEVSSLKNQVSQYRQVHNISYTQMLDETDLPNSQRKRKADDTRSFVDAYKSRCHLSQDPMDDDSLTVQTLEEDFEALRKHAGSPSDILLAACLRKPDYEHYAVEPMIETHSVITQPTTPSAVSASPRPESTSSGVPNRSNCLENLVKAIEQIEGTQVLTCKDEEELFSQEQALLTSEARRISSHSHSTTHSSVIKPMISPYTEHIIMAASLSSSQPNSIPCSVTPTTAVSSTPLTLSSERSSTSQEYPIVSKLLNRPIPHKYLHRPQVVVNSSH